MYIRWFKELTIKDIPLVGGKNASLGEMYSKLTKKGVPIPNGFAVTAAAYRDFLRANQLDKKIKEILKNLNVKDVKALALAGQKIRKMILQAEFSKELKAEIESAYRKLGKLCDQKNVDVAVRSSATAEDLPDASFAGQQESYLNIRGEKDLLLACQKCLASLFTDRAISYREAKGYDHLAVALSIGIQQMIRSDLAASGVMFTLDTESGFSGVVLINASYGLGENIVKGRVKPDQFFVFKEGLKKHHDAIISRRLGTKEVKLIYNHKGTKQQTVGAVDRRKFCLADKDILELSRWGVIIENHYHRPMDIEWAKDGASGKLYIVQARSETVKSRLLNNVIETYKLAHKSKILVTGISIGQRIGQGKVHVISSPTQMKEFKSGEVLVTRITDPDWEPVMRIASAIVTEQGGKTSHAAIVSRELGVPCVVGATKARKVLKTGEEVTVSCAEGEEGYVYKGRLPFEIETTEIKEVGQTHTKVMMNLGDPETAFDLSFIPNNGVGLAREEFIFTNYVKVHPLALVHFNDIKDKAVREKIEELTLGYKDKIQYGIDKLAEGIGYIATAFYPKDVIVRLSDFKTNEYVKLVGGEYYEPHEENPMLGWRGASRYYDKKYKAGFKLECEAIKKARKDWGLKNIIVMVPFCRTVEEGKKVLETMKEFGLERGKEGLQVYMMCEIPSNVILADEFCKIFDGFSIGSNDLTQLTLGVDRDSSLVSHVYNERNEAVKKLIRDVIQTAHKHGRKIGICGQAPSDYPEYAEFLVQEGIDSISLNPDTVVAAHRRILSMEKKLGVPSRRVFRLAASGKILLWVCAAGLAASLTGITCQTVSNQSVSDDLKAQMESFKADIRQEVKDEMQKTVENATSQYTESSFANFTLTYPSSWSISHFDNGVKFSSPDEKEWFSIAKAKESGVTSTDSWLGLPVAKSSTCNNGDGCIEAIKVLPADYQNKKTLIEIDGTPTDSFNTILGSIKDFKIN